MYLLIFLKDGLDLLSHMSIDTAVSFNNSSLAKSSLVDEGNSWMEPAISALFKRYKSFHEVLEPIYIILFNQFFDSKILSGSI